MKGQTQESRDRIYYMKLKCVSIRVVSWYQGLNQVRNSIISISDVKILYCRLTIF